MSGRGNVYPLLEAVRDQLATVPGVATCRIGMEANQTTADYPMVRIVPGRISDGRSLGRRSVEALIYFGQPIHEFSGGLEAQWGALLAMELALIDSMEQTPGAAVLYRFTVLDEDRIDAYKLLALQVEIVG